VNLTEKNQFRFIVPNLGEEQVFHPVTTIVASF